ncbi:MAG: hypothetical protein FWF80_01340 [Defluviitaleaceae bacterium]|nr:hypothetical protein [Defluviitaleaceae bacterium]
MSKELRRKRAKEKEQMTKLVLTVVVALIFGVIVGFVMVGVLGGVDEDGRIFVNDGASIMLRDDGTFLALLPHNLRFSGTFTETEADGGTIVSFTYTHATNLRTDNGRILGDGITMVAPDVWDSPCAHSHGLIYILQ